MHIRPGYFVKLSDRKCHWSQLMQATCSYGELMYQIFIQTHSYSSNYSKPACPIFLFTHYHVNFGLNDLFRVHLDCIQLPPQEYHPLNNYILYFHLLSVPRKHYKYYVYPFVVQLSQIISR